MTCTNHPSVVDGLRRCAACSRMFCSNCLITLGGRVLCGNCKTERVRDVQSGTSEAMELATVGRRFVALWIDGLLIGLPATLVLVPLMVKTAMDQGPEPDFISQFVAGLLTAPILFVYESLMMAWRGQTLGKMAVKIKVVAADGDDLTTGQAWLRGLIRMLFVSALAFINYLPIFGKQRTCIHDMVAKTRVIRFQG